MSHDTSYDILDLLPEPHRTVAKRQREDAARKATTSEEHDTERARHEAALTRLDVVRRTLLAETGSASALTDPPSVWSVAVASSVSGSKEEQLRADALQARLDDLLAPVEGVNLEDVLRLDRDGTPGPWSSDENEDCWRLHGSVLAPGCVQILKAPKRGTPYAEYWPHAADASLIVAYRTAAPILARALIQTRHERDEMAAAGREVVTATDAMRKKWSQIKERLMSERDAERARADALQQRLDTLTSPVEDVDLEEVLRRAERRRHFMDAGDEVAAQDDEFWLLDASEPLAHEIARLRARLAHVEQESEELRLTLTVEQECPAGAPRGWRLEIEPRCWCKDVDLGPEAYQIVTVKPHRRLADRSQIGWVARCILHEGDHSTEIWRLHDWSARATMIAADARLAADKAQENP